MLAATTFGLVSVATGSDCLDAQRHNPCVGHEDVHCVLGGIKPRELAYLRQYFRQEDVLQNAREVIHRHDAKKAKMTPSKLPAAIEDGKMSWQNAHVRMHRNADPVLDMVAVTLEMLAMRAVVRQAWPMALNRSSDEEMFFAAYMNGGFYARHRDVLPYFSGEVGNLVSAAGVEDVASLVEAVTNTSHGSLFPMGRGRAVTVVVQLAEGNGAEYDGGALRVITGTMQEPGLALPHLNAVRRGSTVVETPACPGDVIIHPSFVPHEVTPVRRGMRESLAWWVPGVAVRAGEGQRRKDEL